MKYTAPEMEAQADAFCKKLRDAGLRVGFCLRPHWNLPKDVPSEEVEKYRKPNNFQDMPFRMTWDKFDIEDNGIQFIGYDEIAHDEQTPLTDVKRSPVQRLDDMITYCKKRWGATLFYVDTNSFRRPRAKANPNAQGGYDELGTWTNLQMSAEQWVELQQRHPDVLLLPEHNYSNYWQAVAPYRPPIHGAPRPADVEALYPDAFSCLAMNGNAIDQMNKNLPVYSAAVERGDLLITSAGILQNLTMQLYSASAATAPVRVVLNADGTFLLQGKPIADLKGLTEAVANLVKGKPFAERRVFVEYDPAASRSARIALLAVLEPTDAIIAWSQPLGVVVPAEPAAAAQPAASTDHQDSDAPIQIVLHADLRMNGTRTGGGEFLLAWLLLPDGTTAPDLEGLIREVKSWTAGKPVAERRASLKVLGGEKYKDAVVNALRQAHATIDPAPAAKLRFKGSGIN